MKPNYDLLHQTVFAHVYAQEIAAGPVPWDGAPTGTRAWGAANEAVRAYRTRVERVAEMEAVQPPPAPAVPPTQTPLGVFDPTRTAKQGASAETVQKIRDERRAAKAARG